MKNFDNNLREFTISHLNGNKIDEDYKFLVEKFIFYMDAYCAEMKTTDSEVLNNDKLYKTVSSLFKSVIMEKQLNMVV
jgi:hypothetical protein